MMRGSEDAYVRLLAKVVVSRADDVGILVDVATTVITL
jgi:hypothetical protein